MKNVLTALACLISVSFFGQIDPEGPTQFFQLNTITTAVPFLMIGPDSRSGALGDAGCAIASDANALYWNPARLSMNEVDDFGISLCYTPFLRGLVDDMNLLYFSRYVKISSKTALGSSFRCFSLGEITFTDEQGQTIRAFRPKEFALDVHLAQRLNDNLGFGISARYIYSNLPGGVTVLGAESKPGVSLAADLSMCYTNGPFNFGVNISNIGSKMSYTEAAAHDFIPTNLRLGVAFKIPFDENNAITLTTDFNKLLVPTQPIYHENGSGTIVSGFDPNVGVATGIVQSFYDAPGVVNFTDSVNLQPVGPEDSMVDVYHDPSEYEVQQGSVFKEELREINIGGGIEYVLFNSYAFRSGYFYEHYSKGNRQFIVIGTGCRFNWLEADFSYIISTTQQNPLANTLRLTLKANINWRKNRPLMDTL